MFELNWQPKVQLSEKLIEEFAAIRGLECSMKGSLKSKPKNSHYHYKKAKSKGVLEVTLFAESIQLNVHQNRKGEWIELEIKAWTEYFC